MNNCLKYIYILIYIIYLSIVRKSFVKAKIGNQLYADVKIHTFYNISTT